MIDRIDRDILRELEKDARISMKDLAETISLSANAVAERVRKLRAQGIIRGFVADIDPTPLGLTMRALIEVKLESSTTAAKFQKCVESTPGVLRVMATTGRYDVVLEVIARDPSDLQRIVEGLREAGLTQDTYSRIIVSDRRLPLTR